MQLQVTTLTKALDAADFDQQQREWKENKTCERCGETYPLRDFSRIQSRPDGYWVHCYACQYAMTQEAKPFRRRALAPVFTQMVRRPCTNHGNNHTWRCVALLLARAGSDARA